MIHFFRRIRQGLLSHNRFSKYILYSIGEIVLVMVGILLALQVNNWRDQNLENREQKKIVSLLIRDLNYNQKDLLIYQNRLNRAERNIKQLLYELDNKSNLDSILQYTRFSLGLYHHRPSYPTYKGLVQGNNLDLITNDSIRDRIIDYFDGYVIYLIDLKESHKSIHQKTSDAIRDYIGYELSDDSSWTHSSVHNLDKLKSDYKTKHLLALLGRRSSFMAKRIDSVFLVEYNKMNQLLSTYLNDLKK